VTALATEAFDLGHRDALNTDVGNSLPHVIEFEWLDNRRDHFHGDAP
jgi:hypothetical protein